MYAVSHQPHASEVKASVTDASVTAATAAAWRLPRIALLALLGVLFPTVASAALFRLADGSDLAAAYIGEVGDVITVLTADGKRKELQRADIVWMDGSHRLSAQMEKRAARARGRFLVKRRKAAEKIARRLANKKKPEQRVPLIAELDSFSELEQVPALSYMLRARKGDSREWALARLRGFKTDAAVLPLVQDSLVLEDPQLAAETSALAVERNADLARRIYEYSAQVSPFSHRLRAVKHLQSIGSRASGKVLVKVLRYVTMTVRVQLARSTGLKEIPVSLGASAQSVVIETPGVELIEVMTSVEVPVQMFELIERSTIEALQSISGEDFGADLRSWEGWVREEAQKEAPLGPPSDSDDSAAGGQSSQE